MAVSNGSERNVVRDDQADRGFNLVNVGSVNPPQGHLLEPRCQSFHFPLLILDLAVPPFVARRSKTYGPPRCMQALAVVRSSIAQTDQFPDPSTKLT